MEKQLAKFMEHDEKTSMVYCGFYVVYDDVGAKTEAKPFMNENNLHRYLLMGGSVCIFPMLRTRCLAEIGGFDEKLTAAQDHQMCVKITEHYKAACVNKPLAIYHKHTMGSISTGAKRRVQGISTILNENKEFYDSDKTAHMNMLLTLAILYRQNGEYKNFFKTFAKAVSLSPFRIVPALWSFFRAFLPWGAFERFRFMISLKFPKVYDILRKSKRKFYGEEQINIDTD